jgi:hypothetical protein
MPVFRPWSGAARFRWPVRGESVVRQSRAGPRTRHAQSRRTGTEPCDSAVAGSLCDHTVAQIAWIVGVGHGILHGHLDSAAARGARVVGCVWCASGAGGSAPECVGLGRGAPPTATPAHTPPWYMSVGRAVRASRGPTALSQSEMPGQARIRAPLRRRVPAAAPARLASPAITHPLLRARPAAQLLACAPGLRQVHGSGLRLPARQSDPSRNSWTWRSPSNSYVPAGVMVRMISKVSGIGVPSGS